MTRNHFAQSVTAASVSLLLLAVPAAMRGDTHQRHIALPTFAASQSPQIVTSLDDDFAVLDLTDSQKAEFAKIRKNADAHRQAVAKSANLSQDEKDAMIQGYTRQQYSQMFRTLTPTQQKVVRARIMAQRAPDAVSK